MKPTDEKRSEVARRLRDEGLYESLMPRDQFFRWMFNVVDSPKTVASMTMRLADLIEPEPERTCRAEVLRCREDDGSQSACLVCSECGEKLRYREAAADDGEPDYELLPHCAGCGARVEGADR